MFKKMGFVKLAYPYSYFVIAEENLYPKRLRNIDKLAKYLLNKSKVDIKEEWDEILTWSKKNSKVFYRNRKDKKE